MEPPVSGGWPGGPQVERDGLEDVNLGQQLGYWSSRVGGLGVIVRSLSGGPAGSGWAQHWLPHMGTASLQAPSLIWTLPQPLLLYFCGDLKQPLIRIPPFLKKLQWLPVAYKKNLNSLVWYPGFPQSALIRMKIFIASVTFMFIEQIVIRSLLCAQPTMCWGYSSK